MLMNKTKEQVILTEQAKEIKSLTEVITAAATSFDINRNHIVLNICENGLGQDSRQFTPVYCNILPGDRLCLEIGRNIDSQSVQNPPSTGFTLIQGGISSGTTSSSENIAPVTHLKTSFPHSLDKGLSALRKEMDEKFVSDILTQALTREHGNVSAVARDLKIDRANLLRLFKRFHISPDHFRHKKAA